VAAAVAVAVAVAVAGEVCYKRCTTLIFQEAAINKNVMYLK